MVSSDIYSHTIFCIYCLCLWKLIQFLITICLQRFVAAMETQHWWILQHVLSGHVGIDLIDREICNSYNVNITLNQHTCVRVHNFPADNLLKLPYGRVLVVSVSQLVTAYDWTVCDFFLWLSVLLFITATLPVIFYWLILFWENVVVKSFRHILHYKDTPENARSFFPSPLLQRNTSRGFV